jgi:site-specific DNA recombinase
MRLHLRGPVQERPTGREGRIRIIPAQDANRRARPSARAVTSWRQLIVLANLKHRVLAPDRIVEILKSLMERQTAKSESADLRLLTLQREVSDADDRLRRLYRSIEDGIVEIDDILREPTGTLKSERERAKAALDRACAQCGTVAAIDAQKIDAFARLMTDKLDNGDTNARKGYIGSIIDAVEVDDKTVRIIGSKDVLQAVIAGKQSANGNVRGFVRKWRATADEDGHYSLAIPL